MLLFHGRDAFGLAQKTGLAGVRSAASSWSKKTKELMRAVPNKKGLV